MSNKIYGGLIMDLNVISKLTKLAGYEYLSQEITDLMSDDQVTEFETPYAYYGEFLERQQGYETEKMVSYIFLRNRLRDENINLYQINDIESKIRSLSAGDDPWLRMVDVVFNNRFSPVSLKDYILFLKMARIFSVDLLPEEVRYNIFMENFDDIIRCKFKSDDVIYIFRSLNGIASENKSVRFFNSLFEKKPTEKKIADMCKLGISAVDIQIIYSLLVIGDRKTTNAVVEAFRQLFLCEDDWNDFEQSFVREYWKKKTPTNYEGKCYPHCIFTGTPKNLNNMFFITDNIDDCTIQRVSLIKEDELIPEWKTIFHHFESNKEIFVALTSKIAGSVKATKELLLEFPDINWVEFINEYPVYVKFLIDNNFISVMQVADMEINAMGMVIEFEFNKTFELLSIMREKRPNELLLLFHRINYKYVMTSRELVDFVAQILSEISMVDFDEFLRALLYNDSVARKLFSETELSSLVESYREICKYYDNYRKSYRSCSSSDAGWLFDIYATAEEKKAKADAEEEKKIQDIISNIRTKMADNKNGIFGVECRDFMYCCYYSNLYIPVWNRLKEETPIPTEICVCSRDEYFEMVENIYSYARNFNFSIPEFQEILNKIKIMED